MSLHVSAEEVGDVIGVAINCHTTSDEIPRMPHPNSTEALELGAHAPAEDVKNVSGCAVSDPADPQQSLEKGGTV